MKGFFKLTLASILGVLIGLFIFILIILGIVSASSKEKPVIVEENTILYTEFSEPIVDRQPESPFDFINPMSLTPEGRAGLDNILKNIRKAGEDENISGIVMNLSMIPTGMATLNEIRDALLEFKKSGKFIYSYSDIYTQGSYYLATAADKIYIAPQGQMVFMGLNAEVVFLKGTLDKMGIEFQVMKHGEYKGATEQLVYKKLSKENREQIQDYLNSLWNHILEGVAEARDINLAELNRIADNIEVNSAKTAFENKLVDGLMYYDEFLDTIKSLTGTAADKDIKSIDMKKYTRVPEKRESKGLERNKIAVIYAQGTIISGEGGDGYIGGDRYSKVIRQARRDSTIKAIVLRVNSGGGDGLASDIIWREVKLAAEVKPVIATMGDVAASGGYYIVAPATKIIANPNTLTGSIGVFGVWPNAQKLANEKLGITTDVVSTNEHSNFGSFLEPLSEFEKQKIQSEIDEFYKGFVEIVAEGRAMTVEEVDKIARGHVYSGSDALKIGLIDDFGGLEKAIQIAAEEADLETYRIVKLPKLEDPIQKIIDDLTGNSQVKILEEQLGENFYYYEQLKKLKDLSGIQAVMPYNVRIK